MVQGLFPAACDVPRQADPLSDARWLDAEADLASAVHHVQQAAALFAEGNLDGDGFASYRSRMARRAYSGRRRLRASEGFSSRAGTAIPMPLHRGKVLTHPERSTAGPTRRLPGIGSQLSEMMSLSL